MREKIKEAAEKYVTKGGKYALDILDEEFVKQTKKGFEAGAEFMLDELGNYSPEFNTHDFGSYIKQANAKIAKLTEANDELTRQNKILREALEYVLEDHDCEHIDCIEFNKQRAREALKSCGGGDNE